MVVSALMSCATVPAEQQAANRSLADTRVENLEAEIKDQQMEIQRLTAAIEVLSSKLEDTGTNNVKKSSNFPIQEVSPSDTGKVSRRVAPKESAAKAFRNPKKVGSKVERAAHQAKAESVGKTVESFHRPTAIKATAEPSTKKATAELVSNKATAEFVEEDEFWGGTESEEEPEGSQQELGVPAKEHGLGQLERGLGQLERGLGQLERGLGQLERGLGQNGKAEENESETIADSQHEGMHWYYRGLEMLKKGEFDSSVKALRQFLREYPDHVYSDRAEYLILRSHFLSREYGLVVVASNLLETRYPFSFRIPEALYHRAISFSELGQKELARSTLKDLLQRYPGEIVSENASRKLAELSMTQTGSRGNVQDTPNKTQKQK